MLFWLRTVRADLLELKPFSLRNLRHWDRLPWGSVRSKRSHKVGLSLVRFLKHNRLRPSFDRTRFLKGDRLCTNSLALRNTRRGRCINFGVSWQLRDRRGLRRRVYLLLIMKLKIRRQVWRVLQGFRQLSD